VYQVLFVLSSFGEMKERRVSCMPSFETFFEWCPPACSLVSGAQRLILLLGAVEGLLRVGLSKNKPLWQFSVSLLFQSLL
jgi:hypothetical protein